jgi:hypothetical protein
MKKASALESKRRGRLVKIATGDLLALKRKLRELQKPQVASSGFWSNSSAELTMNWRGGERERSCDFLG